MAKCKNCKHLSTMQNYKKESYKWCSLIDDCPQEDIERNCDFYVHMTNADRIRSMTDEELTRVLKKAFNCGGLIAMNQSSTECRSCKAGYCCNIDDWLKAESEE